MFRLRNTNEFGVAVITGSTASIASVIQEEGKQ